MSKCYDNLRYIQITEKNPLFQHLTAPYHLMVEREREREGEIECERVHISSSRNVKLFDETLNLVPVYNFCSS
jgi:hypothetical protein